MNDNLIMNEVENFYQYSYLQTDLMKYGFFVEIDDQSLTLYREEWYEGRSILPAIGIIRKITAKNNPYYLFGKEMLNSSHYPDLATAVENLVQAAKEREKSRFPKVF